MEIKGKGLFPSPFLSLCSFPFNASRDWPMISILRALYWKEAQESWVTHTWKTELLYVFPVMFREYTQYGK